MHHVTTGRGRCGSDWFAGRTMMAERLIERAGACNPGAEAGQMVRPANHQRHHQRQHQHGTTSGEPTAAPQRPRRGHEADSRPTGGPPRRPP